MNGYSFARSSGNMPARAFNGPGILDFRKQGVLGSGVSRPAEIPTGWEVALDQSSSAAPDFKLIVAGANQVIVRRRQHFRQSRLQAALCDARLHYDHAESNGPPRCQRTHGGLVAAHEFTDAFSALPAI
jgi:hypothetical protein